MIEDINSRTAQTEKSGSLKRHYLEVYSCGEEKRKKGKGTKRTYGKFEIILKNIHIIWDQEGLDNAKEIETCLKKKNRKLPKPREGYKYTDTGRSKTPNLIQPNLYQDIL